ncbi:MAG: polysaccharide biosynthesis/export family protein [Acidobacteriota bacterium]
MTRSVLSQIFLVLGVLAVPSGVMARPQGGGQLVEQNAPAPNYVIGKEDVLQVSVFGEPELSVSRVPVRPDGRISLPLIGDVFVEGQAPEDLARQIARFYTEHVVAPSVSVIVVEVNSFKVFITGNVQRPGVFKLGRETTLLQALALAGGFTSFANSKKIVLIRETAGKSQRIQINYGMILSGENLEMNLRLKPGDTVVVP